METNHEEQASECVVESDRRKFIAACGRFAVVSGPAITLLLSTSLKSKAAIVASGGGASGTPDYSGFLNPPT
jgi:hypothetical protein